MARSQLEGKKKMTSVDVTVVVKWTCVVDYICSIIYMCVHALVVYTIIICTFVRK